MLNSHYVQVSSYVNSTCDMTNLSQGQDKYLLLHPANAIKILAHEDLGYQNDKLDTKALHPEVDSNYPKAQED